MDHTCDSTTLTLPGSTTIGSLKRKEIWNDGENSYPASQFTLSHDGRRLQDDETLFDLAFERDDNCICLDVDTFDVVLKNVKQNTETTVTLNSEELQHKDRSEICDIIKQKISSAYYRKSIYITTDAEAIHTSRWSMPEPATLYPGAIVFYKVCN